MLFILNNLVLPLSFNYQQFLLFFGEFFLLVMLLFFLLDIANPKFEIMPSQRLTSFTLKLSNRVSNTLILTFGLILINAMPRKDLIFSDSINISKTTCWLFFDKIATDLYTSAIKLLILFSSILILKFSHGFIVELHKVENNLELPLLLGFATFFLLILTSTMDLVVLGLTMEGLSLTLYVLINVNLHWEAGLEASIKYFSLGGIMSAFSWLGIGLIYGVTDLTNFIWLSSFITTFVYSKHALLNLGLLFIILSFLFKLSAFPCHVWSPEVYLGCALPITAYLMVPTKLAFFSIFSRILYYAFWPLHSIWQVYITIAAIGSLILGAILTLNEKLLKRWLASASINQMGILLLGLSCTTWHGLKSTYFYLFIYILTMLLFFCIILSTSYNNTELKELSKLSLFSKKNALFSSLLTLTVINMGGLPPTLGFFGKFYIFLEVSFRGDWESIIIGFSSSLVSAYYYIHLIFSLYFENFFYRGLAANTSIINPYLYNVFWILILLSFILSISIFTIQSFLSLLFYSLIYSLRITC